MAPKRFLAAASRPPALLACSTDLISGIAFDMKPWLQEEGVTDEQLRGGGCIEQFGQVLVMNCQHDKAAVATVRSWIKRKVGANGRANLSLIASARCQYIRGHQQKLSDRLNLCAL
ncbi:hypothetical protein [Rhizobium binae]|uniref:hypothetical protein n=1 Tax=Rhizobium binae TaxID=1138190 RepID=UPI001C834AC1|nr:hypothetical protein [Rhizobium binae]MBX4945521.1 hypothetical protein [Rhizobium binae]MBX4980986.1 hypothetical protein [Rhizobium binae]